MIKQEFYSRKFAKNLSLCGRLEKVLAVFKEHHFTRLLDIGCGDGSFSVFLKKFCDEVHGIDISDNALGLAKKKGLKVYKVDIDNENLPFKENYFDLVFAGEIIEHLFDPDHLLDEVYRVLTHKGIFILTTPNLASWFNRIVMLFGFHPYLAEVSLRYNVGKFGPNINKFEVSGHLRSFTLRALKELLQLHNFSAKDCLGIAIGSKDIPLIVSFFDRIFSRRASLAQYLVIVAEKI